MVVSRKLAVAAALALAIGAGDSVPFSARGASDRVWIAGRYDEHRVVVYFGTAHFGDTTRLSTGAIPAPKADGFFEPAAISLADIERYRDTASAERFAVGTQYDLLLERGHVATVKLTSLVAFTSDEGVGNASYVGAIAELPAADLRWFTRDYYVLRPLGKPGVRSPRVGITGQPTSAPERARLASLLRTRLTADSDSAVRRDARTLRPAIVGVTPFTLADGSRRLYVRALFRAAPRGACTKVEAWFAEERWDGELRPIATDASSCRYDMPKDAPRLLNVVDLGNGRVGVITEVIGGDGRSLALHELEDGVPLSRMHVLQTIAAGE